VRRISEQNVEAIKRHYEAFNRRDRAGVLADLDPEIEYDKTVTVAVAGPDANVYGGSSKSRSFSSACGMRLNKPQLRSTS
jgi:ketosteroid isomerase-like protein